MPERHLPPDFNLFRYSDRIGGHIYKGTEKDSEGHYGDNLGKAGLRFHSTDERAVRIFKRHYGQELVKEYAPALVVPEVRVYLPYREAYHNYVAGYGEYSGGSGLQRFCDGKTIKLKREKTRYTPPGGKPRDAWAVNEVNEPCPAADSSHPCENCDYVRRLTVYIAELYEEGYRSAFVINSRAINEVNLFHKLADEERRLERFAPGSNVSYMPNSYTSMPDTSCYIRWILKRSPETIGVPAMKRDPKTRRPIPTRSRHRAGHLH